MERLSLGPNGAILFCMEYIEENLDRLKDLIVSQKAYVIFDCPGQVELYTHHPAFRNIVERITKWGMQVRQKVCILTILSNYRLEQGVV